ncbi:MAG: GDSL-type esterase/lipase family protein [Verrucomicrobiota bacterium]
MSFRLSFALLATGCVFAAATGAVAQPATLPSLPAAVPSLEALKTSLTLTEAQVSTIAPLLAEVAQARESLVQSQANMVSMRGGLADKIMFITRLSEEQKARLADVVNRPYFTSRIPIANGQHVDWASRLDWDLADLLVYREKNAQLGPPAPGENRVIFIGDSITENWQGARGDFNGNFGGKTNYIGRGRTSETTQQMLLRFRPDVIDLKPKAVVILAGTNDVAGNLGRSTDKMIEDNLISMIDLAALNKIKVVLCSIMPTTRYSWQPSVTDGTVRVIALNKWIKEYSATRPGEVFFVDIHTPMASPTGGMNPQLSGDGTHPNAQGYALISPLVDQAINAAFAAK